MNIITRRGALALGSGALLLPSLARAQSWPSGPVTLVVGYAAGGGADINARELAHIMSPMIGQQIVVDNKGGAAGSIGLRAVAGAKPDGQTLFYAVGTNVIINPWVQKGMIDTIATLAPICQTTAYQYVLAVNPKVAANSAAELVEYATQRGVHVSLSPSVTPRLTAPRLAELRAAGASAVSLSLDGARPETHDALRGIAGTHRDTLLAADLVRAAGLRLQINTTVHAGNVDELPDLVAWLVGQEVSLWSVFLLVPTGRGTTMHPLDADRTEDLLHWLHEIGDLFPVKTTEAPHFRRHDGSVTNW